MPGNTQNTYNPHWYCHHCGADFRHWMQLPGEVRREFVRNRPEYDIVNLVEGRCPRCGGTIYPH